MCSAGHRKETAPCSSRSRSTLREALETAACRDWCDALHEPTPASPPHHVALHAPSPVFPRAPLAALAAAPPAAVEPSDSIRPSPMPPLRRESGTADEDEDEDEDEDKEARPLDPEAAASCAARAEPAESDTVANMRSLGGEFQRRGRHIQAPHASATCEHHALVWRGVAERSGWTPPRAHAWNTLQKLQARRSWPQLGLPAPRHGITDAITRTSREIAALRCTSVVWRGCCARAAHHQQLRSSPRPLE